ncbi:heat-inducible transcriptional repressor HrcA [Chakrabartyella piscis]|uniref:heat-inducible transcriptional repressor HrcA n=1 Tax=Chakrabartyella piscis TaxID=2918914 RepID=UPI0029589836|nr:heat-inducible transcriptional repressor HrcA [Chakrabartyella piscis]
MSLNDRKISILQAIINDYIETAEPVGSRTIAKKYNLGISSATIRNEMSDLEEMGFIMQPHASAGRIPSDLGYRLYVDHLMQKKELNADEQVYLKGVIARDINQIDFLMEETAKVLSTLTNYTTFISEPMGTRAKIKQIRLLPLDQTSILLVIATEDNFIKNHIIKMNRTPEDQMVFEIGHLIHKTFEGCALNEINGNSIHQLQEALGIYDVLIDPILQALQSTMLAAEKVQVHMSGTKNILAFPEFSDIDKAKSLFQVLEEKDVLVNMLEENKGTELQIRIGSENAVQCMQDCSIITATYKLSDDTRGTIGIVGPTRMDYSQVVSVLNGMVKNIEKVLRNLTDHNDS